MIKLGLIRHGHTAWNRAGRIQGRTDIPLDDGARAGLSELCLPQGWSQAELWSSPLARAAETALLISDRKPRTTHALMEMNWGDWEGQEGAELHADPTQDYKPIEDWGWDYTPPNGESPASLRARLSPWISTLDADSVAVCHIGVMRAALAMATGWEFNGPAPFQIKRNRLYVIEVTGTKMQLRNTPERLTKRPT